MRVRALPDSFGTILLLSAALLVCASGVRAQSGGSYTLTSSTVDSGGGKSSSMDGRYSVSGTVGQPDAGTLRGGPYTLYGGFWGLRVVSVSALAALAAAGLGFGLGGSGLLRLRSRRARALA